MVLEELLSEMNWPRAVVILFEVELREEAVVAAGKVLKLDFPEQHLPLLAGHECSLR